ncbi:hypothetical protein FXO38_26982 [Capsicum annuum]|nr:hypothetical protein FXO38_26982 [Capsicum annuum]
MAQSRLQGLQHIVAFGRQKNTVVILGMDGRESHFWTNALVNWKCGFYQCLFDAATGGEMTLFKYQACSVHAIVLFSPFHPPCVAFVFAVYNARQQNHYGRQSS